ncbi:MAG TPA: glucoamylase family protein, partial [Methylomirabilota bacterium]|nr:glucoamylase family protein [Methylomirabilota bacterium]
GDVERVGDPGFYLVSHGRPALEREIGFRAPARLRLSRLQVRLGIVGYVGAIATLAMLIVAAATLAMAAQGATAGLLVAFAVLAFIPATEVAMSLVNRAVTWSFGATALPALSLADGVPARLRTLVVVPTLLTNEADLLEQIERLEVHHLSGAGGDISFAILSDGVDWDREEREADVPLLAVARKAIDRLNTRHRVASGGVRFHFLHRRRQFNSSENVWMGWERKRGKLHELNRLLRGSTDTSFMTTDGRSPDLPAGVRYVITLDADTRLPRDAANRLIGKMAHPLNRPSWSEDEQRVVGGYAILQPRVTPSLPVGTEGSAYQRIFSAPGGMDPYAAAVSDVYQDLFGEGSYTGKGIYDVDAFEAALAGRVPENTMLSHDLFEGVFARAGLASDVEVVEEFPARYDVASKRQHRWVRGDWQLLPWIFGFPPGRRPLPSVGRGKMLDNLRRSLLAPFLLAALGVSWLMPIAAAVAGTLFLLATIAIPALMPIAFSLVPPRAGIRVSNHLMKLLRDLKLAAAQVALTVAFLPDHAWRMGDAIGRTSIRLFITRKHLLEWTTAARSSAAPRSGLAGFAWHMAGGTTVGVLLAAAAVILTPTSWLLALPFAALWLGGPAIALWASRSPSTTNRYGATAADLASLRLIARRTWRYFETFVTPADSMLPPDNFQEDPEPVIAHRTSPTNIGLYLLSAVVARDFGWAGTIETVERLEATFASMRKMRRFNGHFFNWYETTDLRVLEPAYISSVDSGNLAGHLIALANACEEWSLKPFNADIRKGMSDTLELARLSVEKSVGAAALSSVLEEIRTRLGEPLDFETLAPQLRRLTEKAVGAALVLAPGKRSDDNPDIVFWTSALRRAVLEERRDREVFAADGRGMTDRLLELAAEARRFASAMDFAFLLDRDRHLLSIGYSLDDNTLDPSCYDLLASEARLASLFAIAKGDVETRHWFRLGRSATPLGNASALISWSGSMFEYLMPSLVMRAPSGSLLDQTNRLVVERQQSYGRDLGIPWGISESAFSARDLELTYQYSNFGVPGLGLKRGLGDNTVVAPYATGLAAMIDPSASVANFARLADLGAVGQYGFFEALDFTKSRLPDGKAFVLVRNFMAHHQGMTIVAIANTLQDGRMRDRFHREPMIKASELLIQERMPRDVAVLHPRAEEVRGSPAIAGADMQAVRRFVVPTGGAPITHLLSNGSYSVLLTATGGGYSRWSDIAVTRWREDPTRDNWGSALFLRDKKSGESWSAAASSQRPGDHSTVTFSEDRA